MHGPFPTYDEAQAAYPGYIEDLDSEGDLGIFVVIKRCQPDVLTIFDEEVNRVGLPNSLGNSNF